VIDQLAQRYTGHAFPMRSGVVYEIEPARERLMELGFRHEA
jgi:hypothetical protein